MDTFTNLIDDLIPNPAATCVAIVDGMYLIVDCVQRANFGDWIITPCFKLQRHDGRTPAFGVVIWVIADPDRVLPESLGIDIHQLRSDLGIP